MRRYRPRFERLETRCLLSAVIPTLTDKPSAPTLALGSTTKMTDTATLTGGSSPTGTVKFTLTSPAGTIVDEEVATVATSTSGTPVTYTATTPNGYTPTAAGTYQWTASYRGDANNTSASTAAPNPVTVTLAAPTLTLSPGATVVFRSGKKLTASIALAAGDNPTGTLTFTLTSAAGGSAVKTEKIKVTGNKTYSTPTGYLPTAAGTYVWNVSYSGDTNNSPATTTSGTLTELVTPRTATLRSTPGPAIVIGSIGKLTDTVTLSGGFKPTGTLTFTLTAPNGTVVDNESVSVKGNGSYKPLNGYPVSSTGIALGTYVWTASYSGDTNNSTATAAAVSEKVRLPSPTLTSTTAGTVSLGSGGKLTDTITLTRGSSPTGTLTVYLFPPGIAPNTGGAGATSLFAAAVMPGKTTYSVTPGYRPTKPGNYAWVAVYSGDSNNSPTTNVVIEAVVKSRWERA